MQDQPLNSLERAKLLMFGVLAIPPVVFLVGLLPAIVLGLGVYLMKKHQDFANLQAAIYVIRAYLWIPVIALPLYLFGEFLLVYFLGEGFLDIVLDRYCVRGDSYDCVGPFGDVEFVACLLLIAAFAFYLIMVEWLLYRPLRAHAQWVERHGIFSSSPQETSESASLGS